MDQNNLEILGRWELDRGPQRLAYDFWWHLGHDIMVTSEWKTPNMVESGVNPELLLAGEYGHQLHVWDPRRRRHLQALDLGPEQQMVLELRPSHDPAQVYGFAGTVVSLKDLSASMWLWRQQNGGWEARKVIEIPAEPADADTLPPLLKGFKAVPPLVTDINLSLDDRFLYVSCWGTGEFLQYDVSDPVNPRKTGSIRLGGFVRRSPHPSRPDRPPITAGHGLSIGSVVGSAWIVQTTVPIRWLKLAVAVLLFGLGLHRLARTWRPRFGGMRVGFVDLAIWSFLMASAHGAGLMLLPFLYGARLSQPVHSSPHQAAVGGWTGLLAVLVHTAGYLVVTGLAAWLVYEKLGLSLLRRAWFNLDLVWSAALIGTGAFILLW